MNSQRQPEQLDLLQTTDLSNANEAVLVANTPSFLLDRLRRDMSVDHVSRTLETSEIIEFLRNCETAAPTRVHDIVQRYVYLVALAMKDPAEVWPILDEIDLSGLEWGEQIRSLMRAQAIPTNNVVLPPDAPALNRQPVRTEASNSLVSENVQRTPGGVIIFP
jgi:hypothetical protein